MYKKTFANAYAWEQLIKARDNVFNTLETLKPQTVFEGVFAEHARITVEKLIAFEGLLREGRAYEAYSTLLGEDIIRRIHAEGKRFPEEEEYAYLTETHEYKPLTTRDVQKLQKILLVLESILREFFTEEGLEDARWAYARAYTCETPADCMRIVESHGTSWWDEDTGSIALSMDTFLIKHHEYVLDTALAAAAHEWGHALSAHASRSLPKSLHISRSTSTPVTLPVHEHYALRMEHRMITWLEGRGMLTYPLRRRFKVRKEKERLRLVSFSLIMLRTPDWRNSISNAYNRAIASAIHPNADPYTILREELPYALEALLLKDTPLVHLGSWNVFTYPRIAGMVKKDMISYEKRG